MALNDVFITDHQCSCLSHCVLGSNDQALLSPSFPIHRCTLQGQRLSEAIGLPVNIPSACLPGGAALAALGSLSGAGLCLCGCAAAAGQWRVLEPEASSRQRKKLVASTGSMIWECVLPPLGPRSDKSKHLKGEKKTDG